MITGTVIITRNGETIQQGQNLVTRQFGRAVAECLGQFRDNRVIKVKFGTGDIPATLASTQLSGDVLYTKETVNAILVDWNIIDVRFTIDYMELQVGEVREIGLFTQESDVLFSHYVLDPPLTPGTAWYDFTWRFAYKL